MGRLISLKLARLGAKVVLWDINRDGLEETKRMIEAERGQAWTYECDVTDRFLVYLTADRVREDVGNVSILVNNAGIVTGKPFLETPDEKIQLTMDVNVMAHFWTLKAFLPHMLEEKHGHIVTISSLAGKITASRLADYCASKFAATGLHEALTQEFKTTETGVHFTNICPFVINTGMFEGAKSRFPAILPELDQHETVDRIVQALQYNEKEVIVPLIFKLVLALNLLLPRKAAEAMSELLGVRELMGSFTGRDGGPGKVQRKDSATTDANFTNGEGKSKAA